MKDLTIVEGTDGGNASLELLARLGVSYTNYSHDVATTVEEQFKHVGHLPGGLTKNLLLRDKKYGIFLVSTLHDRPTSTKDLGTMLGLAKSNLRFADEETLQSTLAVTRGSVSALAVINDTSNQVRLALDKALLSQDLINLHPLRNDRTLSITPDGLMKYLSETKHEPIILDFDSFKPDGGGAEKKDGPKKEAAGGSVTKRPGGGEAKKGETLLGIDIKKEDDFSGWYTQVITYSEMIDYYDISGCYILRPWSFAIWETIQRWFDDQIKALGVQNAYFPLFVSKRALETEKDHVEGFAPEVAWVTKSGDTDLQEPIAVRPTSETIMYPLYAKWIRSHRDLPLLLNQWGNVVRWEFKYPTPFLRSREFLWQEGHTAHASFEESQEMVMTILDLYRRVYEELLAVPVITGQKTESEKFAGGYITTTTEIYINGSGRSIQGATSHNLGQNFGKMFNINYEDKKGQSQIPWQTSWGLTTRSIGVMVMVHGDNRGLVLPPRVAPLQVVIVPIIMASSAPEKAKALDDYCEDLLSTLKKAGVKASYDDRTNYTAGWKFNHWEQKGVPVRLEVGPRDLEKRMVRLVRRDTGDKADYPMDNIVGVVKDTLDAIQTNLFERSKAERDQKYIQVTRWEDFVPALNKKCIVLTPFCNETEWEETVKKRSREEAGGDEDARTATSVAAKTLCIPFEQPPLPPGTPCFVSGKEAKKWVLWGRSY